MKLKVIAYEVFLAGNRGVIESWNGRIAYAPDSLWFLLRKTEEDAINVVKEQGGRMKKFKTHVR